MDPVSFIGLIESSIGLALQFGSAAKTLNDLAGKYKNTKLAIKSLAQNLDILQLAWTQIGDWMQFAENESFSDNSLTKRVEGFWETGTLVMEALQHDLQAYDTDQLNISQRTRLIWNETTFQAHQNRIRDQALSMSLFLQAMNLPTAQGRAKLLQEAEIQFQKSNESAYSIDSIVPSRMSVSTSRRDSYGSIWSQDTIEYRPLTFEKKLFMSKVYIRSSKNVMFKELSKAKISFKPKATAGAGAGPTSTNQAATDWEAIRDQLEADSLLVTSCDVSINDNETIKSYDNPESRPFFSEEVNAIDVPSTTFVEELMLACEQGDTSKIEWLVSRGIDLHTQFDEYSGLTAIHIAAMRGHVNIVQSLLDCGVSIEEPSRAMQRPLHVAALKGQVSMVDFLIGRGAQVDAQDTNGNQPIHEAAKSYSTTVLDALFEAGATVDCSNQIGYQPLHYASMERGNSSLIRSLCKMGANIEAKTSNGSRPIHLAMKHDNFVYSTNLSTLLALGAKMEYHDGTEPALNTAVSDLFVIATEELLRHGADPDCQGHDGKTALHTLASIKCRSQHDSLKSIKIFRLLFDRGAAFRMKDRNGNQMLHLIASQGKREWPAAKHLAYLVIREGADTDETNNDGLSPLCLAMKVGFFELSRLLIESGARVWMKSDDYCADIIDTHDGLVFRTQRLDPGSEQEWTESERQLPLRLEDAGYFTKPILQSRPLCDALVEARDSNSVVPPTTQVSSAMLPSFKS